MHAWGNLRDLKKTGGGTGEISLGTVTTDENSTCGDDFDKSSEAHATTPENREADDEPHCEGALKHAAAAETAEDTFKS